MPGGAAGVDMKYEDVRAHIEQACARLYRAQKDLIDRETHERTIVNHLADYMRPLFAGFAVDTEYNREGQGRDPKRDERGRLYPDIIIHTRGQRLGPNLVAIEVKGHWNPEDRGFDEENLRRMAAEYRYQFLFRIELDPDGAELIRVEPAIANAPVEQ
jgi:hypothetical protein